MAMMFFFVKGDGRLLGGFSCKTPEEAYSYGLAIARRKGVREWFLALEI